MRNYILSDKEKAQMVQRMSQDSTVLAYRNRINYLYAIAPVTRVYNAQTHELNTTIPQEYQKLVDHQRQEMEDYLHKTYPDLYETTV